MAGTSSPMGTCSLKSDRLGLNPSCTTYWLCDPMVVTYPLWASVFPSVNAGSKDKRFSIYKGLRTAWNVAGSIKGQLLSILPVTLTQGAASPGQP